jgi:hypothetical protein
MYNFIKINRIIASLKDAIFFMSNKKAWLIVLLLSFHGSCLFAQSKKFIMSENCVAAFNSIFSLRMEEGKQYLIKEITTNPSNSMPVLIQNYIDFISLTFNDNENYYKTQLKARTKRLDYLDDADRTSPYYLYSKAVIHFQWSIIKAKYKDYISSAFEFRQANQLLKENEKKFPSFIYNKTYLGVQQSIMSSIPDGYKWLTNIMGLKGNLKVGLNNLQFASASSENKFKDESIFFYIYLKAYIDNKHEEAIKLAESMKLNVKTNHMFTFMMANLYLNNKRSTKCETTILNRNK